MGLRDITLKKSYDSDIDDILNDFYIPALFNSVCYKRLTGFFSSTVLALAAKGISRLIKRNGQMELITGAKFSKSDIEIIQEAYADPKSILERTMLEELEHLEEEIVRDHVRALGWMVAKGTLRIKVAIVYDERDFPLEHRKVENTGIFHQKVGILEDEMGNMLSFSGSDNETAYGWLGNVEEFKVFRNWIDTEKAYFSTDLNKFNKFWSGSSVRTKVVDIPKAVEDRLIQIAPQSFEQLKIDSKGTKITSRIKLRNYQEEAIKSWLKSSGKGIIEMATGTGKTFVALGCLEKTLREEASLVTVISVPYIHLIDQWIEDIHRFGIEGPIVIANSDKPNWRDDLTNGLLDVKNGINKRMLILTTHATLSSESFTNIITKKAAKLCLIADEVHGIGAPQRKKALVKEYDFRLGLSATPRRWFDPYGTEELHDFFNGVIFEFSLKKAIGPFLAEYEYNPHFVELTKEEVERYLEETLKISEAYHTSKNDEERQKFFSLLCIKRQNIVKNAINKYNTLESILNSGTEIKHCLIYCSPQQIDRIQKMLNKNHVIQHKFTQIEGTKPKEKYGSVSERKFLLEKFSDGTIHALVAMKCLDEGVDIPSAKLAIMMSNSGNPREYIQRRGRILRKHTSKKFATIHDVIVAPTPGIRDPKLQMLERNIFSRELKRYKEFASIARNSVECLNIIGSMEEKYHILR